MRVNENRNQDTALQMISDYNQLQQPKSGARINSKQTNYLKSTFLNTARVGGSSTGFGNAMGPDGGSKTQRYNNKQVVQVNENRGGLSKTTMVFVVNKEDNTVDFNNTGIGQMSQQKISNVQRNSANNSKDVLSSW